MLIIDGQEAHVRPQTQKKKKKTALHGMSIPNLEFAFRQIYSQVEKLWNLIQNCGF